MLVIDSPLEGESQNWLRHLYGADTYILKLYDFTDAKGYLVDDDGFDFLKISFLRDIKAQQRSLRFFLFCFHNSCADIYL